METVVETFGLAGARPCPEAGYAVVGAGGEDVPQGVPVHRPDGVVVGVLDTVSGVDGLWGCIAWVGGVVGGDGRCGSRGAVGFVEEVVIDGAVVAAGGKKGSVHRMPCECRDVLFEAAEEADVAHHTEVEDTGCLVSGASCEELAAGGLEHGFRNGVLVAVESSETAACSGVPELDLVVFGAGDEEAFCRVPVYRFGIPLVAGEDGFFDAACKVEYLESGVVTCGDELVVVG